MASAFFGPAADGLVPQTIVAERAPACERAPWDQPQHAECVRPRGLGAARRRRGPRLCVRDRRRVVRRERRLPGAARRRRADARAAPLVRRRAPGRLPRGDDPAAGCGADPRLRDHELHVRVVPRARPARLPRHFGSPKQDWGIVSACGSVRRDRRRLRVREARAAPPALRRVHQRRRSSRSRSPPSPSRSRGRRSRSRGGSGWARSRSRTRGGRRRSSG